MMGGAGGFAAGVAIAEVPGHVTQVILSVGEVREKSEDIFNLDLNELSESFPSPWSHQGLSGHPRRFWPHGRVPANRRLE